MARYQAIIKKTGIAVFAICILFIVSCNRNHAQNHAEEHFDKEIRDRIAILEGLYKYDVSLKERVSEIGREITNLRLMCKDVENLPANTVTANSFFRKQEGQPSGGFEYALLDPGMSSDEISVTLKQNELQLLNTLIFQNSGADLRLFSVQDETGEE